MLLRFGRARSVAVGGTGMKRSLRVLTATLLVTILTVACTACSSASNATPVEKITDVFTDEEIIYGEQ